MDSPASRPAVSLSRYLLSFPERLLRASAAAIGGLVFETSQLVLPVWLRSSRLYQAVVYRLLRLTVELVGGVRGVFPPDEIAVGELAVRKGIGNVIELAGFIAMGWSPLWLLAAASDITGGTRVFLNALIAELQKDGLLLEEHEQIASIDDLLEALEVSSGVMADMVDVPPLRLKQLQASWSALKGQAGRLPDSSQLTTLYNRLQSVAQQQGRSVGDLSALLAAGALRAGVQLGSAHIFDYYREALRSVSTEGWGAYARRVAHPYYTVARSHFDPRLMTFTERAINRIRKAQI